MKSMSRDSKRNPSLAQASSAKLETLMRLYHNRYLIANRQDNHQGKDLIKMEALETFFPLKKIKLRSPRSQLLARKGAI